MPFVIGQPWESNLSFVMEDKSNRCFKRMKTLIILEWLSKLYAKASIGNNKKDHERKLQSLLLFSVLEVSNIHPFMH